MKRKQPIKLKVRRNPRTGSYVAVRPVDNRPKGYDNYLHVHVTAEHEVADYCMLNQREYYTWPSVPWEEVPLRVRAAFRKMLREGNEDGGV